MARVAVVALVGMVLLVPLFRWAANVRFAGWPASTIAISVMIGLALLGSFARVKIKRWGFAIMAVVAAISAAMMSPLFGPHFIVPASAMGIMVSLSVVSRADRRLRWFFLAMGVLAFAVPATLQTYELIPRSYELTAGNLKIVPWNMEFSSTRINYYLWAQSLAIIALPLLVIGRSLDRLGAAERRLFAQAWTLRQLMPKPAQEAAEPHLSVADLQEEDWSCPTRDKVETGPKNDGG